MTHPGTRPYLWMLCGSFAFTGMAELASGVTKVCDWPTVAVARAFLVFVFGLVICAAARVRIPVWRPWRLWLRSVAGSCSMVCTFYAFYRLPVTDVVTLTNTFPIWVALLSWPLYRQAPGRNVWVAVVAGVVGVALIEQPHLEAGNWGAVSALAAAGFTAVAMLGLHSLHAIDPRAVVVHFSGVATAACLGVYFALPREVTGASVFEPVVALKLLGMGLSATLGQICLTLAFGSGAPAKVSVVGLTQIVFAMLYDLLTGQYAPHNWALSLLGTALVIAPTAWLLTRPTAPASLDADEEPDAPAPPAGAEVRTPDVADSAVHPTSLRP